ncbi:MAG: hypothetical protein KGJ62_07240 [Armatimonadetes bacterium]|nr:hypothetical protein [Armatimonadota bacterium]MDE2207103.1 hypothetical protein [Armatimonadota bacterium]
MKCVVNMALAATALLVTCMPSACQTAVQSPQPPPKPPDYTQGFVGKKAASFTLPAVDGKSVTVGRQFGKRPVILIFYRGIW